MYLTLLFVAGLPLIGLALALELGLKARPDETSWKDIWGSQIALAALVYGAYLLTKMHDDEPMPLLWYALLAYGAFWLRCGWVWFCNRRVYARHYNKTLKA